MAGQVPDPATKEQERTEGQRVPGDDPLQLRWGEVQLALDGRKRHVDDAEIELQNELRSDYQPKGQTQARERRCAGISRLRTGGGARFVGHDRRCRSA
jgi:hypothetical protein